MINDTICWSIVNLLIPQKRTNYICSAGENLELVRKTVHDFRFIEF